MHQGPYVPMHHHPIGAPVTAASTHIHTHTHIHKHTPLMPALMSLFHMEVFARGVRKVQIQPSKKKVSKLFDFNSCSARSSTSPTGLRAAPGMLQYWPGAQLHVPSAVS